MDRQQPKPGETVYLTSKALTRGILRTTIDRIEGEYVFTTSYRLTPYQLGREIFLIEQEAIADAERQRRQRIILLRNQANQLMQKKIVIRNDDRATGLNDDRLSSRPLPNSKNPALHWEKERGIKIEM